MATPCTGGRSFFHKEEIIGIVVSISTIVLLVAFIVMRHYQRKWKIANILKVTGLKEFSYGDISSGTGNFERENLLGEGGFGQVYKVCLNVVLNFRCLQPISQ